MTGFSTPFPGSLSAGLNSLSAPIGSGPPASLVAQLLARASAVNSLPGSPAPQLPLLPRAPHTGVGPGASLPAPAQPPQNSLLSLLGGLGGGGVLGNGAGGSSSLLRTDLAPSWSNSGGLFGGAGPLFGGPLQGPTPSGATLDTTGLFGSNGFLASLFGGSTGAGAASAAATDAPLAGLGDLLGFTSFL